jgi:hypothetical protein
MYIFDKLNSMRSFVSYPFRGFYILLQDLMKLINYEIAPNNYNDNNNNKKKEKESYNQNLKTSN